MRIRRALCVLGPSLAAALGAASVPWLRVRVSDLLGAAIWGLALLASFIGWGAALLRLLRLSHPFGWGLPAALGMALAVAIGGVLQVGWWMSPSSAVVLLAGGLGALAWVRWQDREDLVDRAASWFRQVRATPWFSLLIASLYCLALFRFLGSLVTPVANPWDDLEAYFVFPKALLADGALHEPFSVRRLINLGGHPYLQSLLLVGSSPERLNGFDSGLCLLTLFGLVDGSARRHRAARVLTLLFLLGFVYEVHNVNSALSGSVFFFALFCVTDVYAADLDRVSVQAVLAALGAAAWTMRQNYLVTVIGVLCATYALHAWRGRLRWGQAALGLARIAGLATPLLLPWWAVAWRSGGTFLYPAVLGNGRADFGLTGVVSVREELAYFGFNALWNHPVYSIWLFVAAALCLARIPKNLSFHGLLIGTGIGVFAIIHACRSWDDVESMSRYYMAFEIALVLAVLLECSEPFGSGEAAALSSRTKIAFALSLLAALVQLVCTADQVLGQYSLWGQKIVTQLPKPTAVEPQDRVYQRLQRAIPAGARFLEILDQPYRLDFRRNQILICDMPGGSSPPPGLPIYGDVRQYERYFAEHSIRYLAYTLGPASPEYRHGLWLGRLRKLDPRARTGHTLSTLFRHVAVIYLDVFDKLEQLEQRHAAIFREGQIRVLDLASGPPSP